jgi:[amino group carrier protein]-L-2-aminoadipate 6-kinase
VKMIVVKIGGSVGINYQNLVSDIANHNEKIVLIHGGSSQLNKLQEKLGNPVQTIVSPSGFVSRRTDAQTIEMFCMVYCGQMNKMLVTMLQKEGINAVGLSGVDGRLFEGKRRTAIRSVENGKTILIRDDLSGRVEKTNSQLIQLLLDNNYFPVITPPAISYENDIINTDGDVAAAQLAQDLIADTLVILSNTNGLLKDLNDPNSTIRNIPREELENFMQYAQGRMKKKVLGAQKALASGIKKVIFANANVDNPLTSALAGQGTVIE